MIAPANGKKQNGRPKSFMTAGPTLHYSHANVNTCWLLAVFVFTLCCMFWAKMLTGSFIGLQTSAENWREFFGLGQFVVRPLSIFEYPWQILVLGLLMGALATVPVLVSQLFSFVYSLPFVFAVAVVAGLPGFAGCVLVGCIGAACRPLRFRSRIIAIALCMSPQILYWIFLGGAGELEPIKWGFSFAPWVAAWLAGLALAGAVLGLGHYTRYRPGAIWVFTLLTAVLALWTFHAKTGFDEFAYQRYIARNDPEQVPELHDHSITEALDRTMNDPEVRRFFSQFFYPSEPILLRAALKRKIQTQLAYDRWPSWFEVPEELNYQAEKRRLHRQYQLFINPPQAWWMPEFIHEALLSQRARSRRMPTALYYKALLTEYSPDIKLLGTKEILHFYTDYPTTEALPVWYRLYDSFGSNPASIEARWRIAVRLAGQGNFKEARKLIDEARDMLRENLNPGPTENNGRGTLLTVFGKGPQMTLTTFESEKLHQRLAEIDKLISPENVTESEQSQQLLAKFVLLNPHEPGYEAELAAVLAQVGEDSPLRDNLLLARAMLIADTQSRAGRLAKIAEQFKNKDGGIRALFELALLRVKLWQQRESQASDSRQFLINARQTLSQFIELYPDSIHTDRAKSLLAGLPASEQ